MLTFTALGDGRWDGTWSPRTAANVSINLSAKSGTLQGTAQITGNLSANPDPPLIATGGLLNAASYALQSPVAPVEPVKNIAEHRFGGTSAVGKAEVFETEALGAMCLAGC